MEKEKMWVYFYIQTYCTVHTDMYRTHIQIHAHYVYSVKYSNLKFRLSLNRLSQSDERTCLQNHQGEYNLNQLVFGTSVAGLLMRLIWRRKNSQTFNYSSNWRTNLCNVSHCSGWESHMIKLVQYMNARVLLYVLVLQYCCSR